MRKNYPRYVISNCLKPVVKRKSWSSQKKTHIINSGTMISMTANFLDTMQGDSGTTSKDRKKKTCQHWILYLVKTSFKTGRWNKDFHEMCNVWFFFNDENILDFYGIIFLMENLVYPSGNFFLFGWCFLHLIFYKWEVENTFW